MTGRARAPRKPAAKPPAIGERDAAHGDAVTAAAAYLEEFGAWLRAHPGERLTRSRADEERLFSLLTLLTLKAAARDCVAASFERAEAAARVALGPGGRAAKRRVRALAAFGLVDEKGRAAGLSRDGYDDGALVRFYVEALRWGADPEAGRRRWAASVAPLPEGASDEERRACREALGAATLPPLLGGAFGVAPAKALELATKEFRLRTRAATRERLKRARQRIRADRNAAEAAHLRDDERAFPIPNVEPTRLRP